jgi:hypothetical protein
MRPPPIGARPLGLTALLDEWLMALSTTRRTDESGGVIGLNGPLVALLCAAYFALFVCALFLRSVGY